MNNSRRSIWLALLSLASGAGVIAVWLYPVSTSITRASGLALFVVFWLSLLGLGWRRRVLRFSLLALTLLIAGFLAWPSDRRATVDALRGDYLAALQRYDGVPYFWGGESPKGIDCSGLVRRGLVDAMFLRGWRTLDPSLVRQSLLVWWLDTTARDLGQSNSGWTNPITTTPSLNELDHTKILPGDLAVTRDGLHILAYLGEQRWIEADPGLHRVVIVNTPSPDNPWFRAPMTIVRWSFLSP